jgi:hypothetical protein
MSRKVRSDLVDHIPVVHCGKTAEEWYSLHCQSVLRLVKAESLLIKVYEGFHKEHWDQGDSEGEVLKQVHDHLQNYKKRPIEPQEGVNEP